MLQNSNIRKGNFLKPDEAFFFVSCQQISPAFEFIKLTSQIVSL